MRRGAGPSVAIGLIVAVVVGWRVLTPSAPPAPDADAESDVARAHGVPPSPLAPAPRFATGDGASGAASSVKRATWRGSGRVVDADGRPIAGAVVRAAGRAATANGNTPPAASPEAITDANGAFVLELASEPASLVVSAADLPERTVALDALASPIALSKSWTISGTVVDATTGAVLDAVPVTANPTSSPESQRPAHAAWRETRFTITLPGPGDYVVDAGRRYFDGTPSPADEYVPAHVEKVAAGTSGLRIELVRGLSIEGSIVDEVGDPVARPVSVRVVGRTPAGDPDYTRRSSVRVANGTLRIQGLPPGAYDLWVVPDPSAGDVNGARVSSAVVRDVAAGKSGLVIRLARGVVVSGRVEDAHGAAITGPGYVYAYREGEAGKAHPIEGEVPGDGTFRVGPLDATLRYDLLAIAFPGWREKLTTRLDPHDPRIVIVLEGAGRIAGRIEAEDGKPVPAGVPVGVLAEGSEAKGVGSRAFAYSKADGTFEADGLAPFVFTVEAGGGKSGYLGTAINGVRTGTTDVVVRVSPGVELSGMLVDDAGTPVSTTSLQADDGARTSAMRPYAQVGLDGRFLLRGLRAGGVRLSLMRAGAWVDAGVVTAPATDVRVAVPAR